MKVLEESEREHHTLPFIDFPTSSSSNMEKH